MRHFPKEIEAELLFRGIDVFLWHRGEMSSRRLLVLIEAIADDPNSALSIERRDKDWSELQYLTAGMLNEIRLLRADQAALHAGKRMDISLVKSPAQTEEDEELREKHEIARKNILSQLRPKITE